MKDALEPGGGWGVLRPVGVLLALLVLASLLVAAASCGEPPPGQSNEEASGETTAETTEETTTQATGSEFRGVVDSYALAHEEIEEAGGEKEVGEYRVGYIVEAAEGWWEGDPENLEWRAPTSSETNHIEILPFDAETGLLVPGVEIDLTIRDEEGELVTSKPLDLYYSEFYHYANNFTLPESGEYTLVAEISPPTFERHGSEEGEGKVFTEPVIVEFVNVEIDTEE